LINVLAHLAFTGQPERKLRDLIAAVITRTPAESSPRLPTTKTQKPCVA
jgi:hypothetical protein